MTGTPPDGAEVFELGYVADRFLRGFVWTVFGLAMAVTVLIAAAVPEARPTTIAMGLAFTLLPIAAELRWWYERSKALAYALEDSGNLWISKRGEWTGPIFLPAVPKVGGRYVTFRSVPHTRHIYLGGSRMGNSDTVDLTFMNRQDAEKVFWFLKAWLTHPTRELHGVAKHWFNKDGVEVTFPW